MSDGILFYPYPHDVILIDTTPEQLYAEFARALEVANGRARVRTAAPLDAEAVVATESGRLVSCVAARGRISPRRSVVGCAWVSLGRKHIRVFAGRVYARAVWGHRQRARAEEFVYPDLLKRIAGLYGYDNVVRGLLEADAYLILADRLEELGAATDADLLRSGLWKVKVTVPPPRPAA